MGKKIIMIVCALAVVLFLAALALALVYGIRKQNGALSPGFLTGRKLSGDWIEIGSGDDGDLCRMTVKGRRISLNAWGEKSEFSYSIPTDMFTAGDGEVMLRLNDCREFENLIYHEEEIDGRTVPILSGTLFEYDGRGEVVSQEFVRSEDHPFVPADFRSSSYKIRNERDPIPTYIPDGPILSGDPVCLDEPGLGGLRKSETFCARVPKNRYGGSCEEGDYAVGKFLLWLCPVELAEDGSVLSAEPVAVPYIVSSGGNGENLSMLSGGNDGLKPYGDEVWRFTTDEHGQIIDAVYVSGN